jgi:hypothetical protein
MNRGSPLTDIQWGKAKLSLCLINASWHEDVLGGGGIVPPFFTLALMEESGERDPDAYMIGGWVGPRAGLDAVKNREISCLRP